MFKWLVKTFKGRRLLLANRQMSRIASQSGQAVLEYLLILIVSVGIVLGVLYQLNTAFKKYVQSYFGDYIACLLETGELPSLGSGDGANAEICSSSFEPFSLKNGRPLIPTDPNGGNRSSSKSNGAPIGSSSSNRGGGRVLRSGLTPNADRGNAESAAAAAVDKNGKKNINGYGGGDDTSITYRQRKQLDEGRLRVSSRFQINGNRDSSAVVKKSQASAQEFLNSEKKISIDLEKLKNRAPASDSSVELSFGDYLRYILILAIIVVIAIFFGGQLFQLKKSWEKN